MSAENHWSSRVLPFRKGALEPAQIRRECPQFRILVIGKANAGKTTILRKVCNATPGAKPIIYDAEGKKVKRDWADVCHGNLAVSGQTNTTLGPCGSYSGCVRFSGG
jgi:hypothetical protein